VSRHQICSRVAYARKSKWPRSLSPTIGKSIGPTLLLDLGSHRISSNAETLAISWCVQLRRPFPAALQTSQFVSIGDRSWPSSKLPCQGCHDPSDICCPCVVFALLDASGNPQDLRSGTFCQGIKTCCPSGSIGCGEGSHSLTFVFSLTDELPGCCNAGTTCCGAQAPRPA
jgi:hypothetical protein